MKRGHSWLVPFFICALASLARGQAVVSAPYAGTAKPSASARESLLIGRGDLLHITVFREPDLEQRVRVKDSGEIDLDLAGTLKVAGLTAADAAKAVAQLYTQGHFLNHPQVSVFLEEYATQSISVLGQVNKPGAFIVTTARSLLDVLAMAGGLTEIADRHITVQRADRSENTVVFLPNDAATSLRAGAIVYPGDTVLVPKAGIVYVLGDVARPGGYVMQNDSQLTVLQAIALAAGASKTASEKNVRLVRNIDGLSHSVDLPLRDMERGRDPDVPLQANDILYVPFSLVKNISLGIADITAAASSALIYAAH